MAKFTPATAAQVRDWANGFSDAEQAEYGLSVGKRGRFAPEVVKAFNRAHRDVKGGPRLRYVEGTDARQVTVTYKADNGRTKTRVVSLAAVREHAGTAHRQGRTPKSAVEAYARTLD